MRVQISYPPLNMGPPADSLHMASWDQISLLKACKSCKHGLAHTLPYRFPLLHSQLLFQELILVNCLEGFSEAHRSGKGYSFEDTCITACSFYLISRMFRSNNLRWMPSSTLDLLQLTLKLIEITSLLRLPCMSLISHLLF